VGQALAGDRVAQRAHHVVLTKDIVEGLGAVFSGEDLVAHGPESRG